MTHPLHNKFYNLNISKVKFLWTLPSKIYYHLYLILEIHSREKKKYEAQIEKVVHMVQKKDREIASLKQVIQ